MSVLITNQHIPGPCGNLGERKLCDAAQLHSVHVELFREQDVGYRELCDVLDASGRKCLLLVLG